APPRAPARTHREAPVTISPACNRDLRHVGAADRILAWSYSARSGDRDPALARHAAPRARTAAYPVWQGPDEAHRHRFCGHCEVEYRRSPYRPFSTVRTEVRLHPSADRAR